MKRSLRAAAITVLAFFLAGSAFAQIAAKDDVLVFVDTDTDHRFLPDPMWPMTENQTNLTGFLSDVTVNPDNTCFSGNPETIFVGGEIVALNVFFEDTVEADQFNAYDITYAIRLRGLVIPLGIRACDQGFGQFSPGQAVTICCVLIEEIPVSPFPFPISLSVDWGARVTKLENANAVQGILGRNISINR